MLPGNICVIHENLFVTNDTNFHLCLFVLIRANRGKNPVAASRAMFQNRE
jgi:hypothetical protein